MVITGPKCEHLRQRHLIRDIHKGGDFEKIEGTRLACYRRVTGDRFNPNRDVADRASTQYLWRRSSAMVCFDRRGIDVAQEPIIASMPE
jgi:hypothetical protein